MLSFLRHRLTPGRIALLYAGFAALWIIVSDGLLNLASDNPALLGWISVIKGLVFVTVTTGLLYFLLQSWREIIVTERQRATEQIHRINRIYLVLSNINQIIVRRKNPTWMMDQACQIVVREGGFRMAWVGIIESETG
ncbi:MAG: hypothetical protein LM550_06625, partial [Candidatus Contendobacter sp.]|nr:hypothetical protein [Candidatus Contendobacter sp.]